ncbi:MAG: universal stress protein [Cyanobacteria bacterium Co-bin8]|nr:universal stress protein [Cyanobacteria bacterium Co-bin8]
MNPRFKRILAALDRSPASARVFQQALALAQQHYSQLMLIHCVGLRTLENWGTYLDAGVGLVSPSRLQRLQELHLDEVNTAWQWLYDQALLAQAEGVAAEITCVTGDASSQICRFARDWDTDLILLGHSGKPGLKQHIFGSTTTHVVLHAPCSVMAVQASVDAQSWNSHQEAQTVPQVCDTARDKRLIRSTWNYAVPWAGS